MKKLPLLFILFIYTSVSAQIEETLLSENMIYSEARYALQQQMATIEYYYFNNYYDGRIKEAEEKYYYNFTRNAEPFELLPKQEIIKMITDRKWKSRFNFTNMGEKGTFYINHDFTGREINDSRSGTRYALPHRNTIRKVFYANGTILNDPEILSSSAWYKNRKAIDSIWVDACMVYPTSLETVKLPVLEARKMELDTGGFIWLMNNDGKRLALAITENITRNMASIHILTADGKRLQNSRGVYTPQQPTTEMYSYASEVYQHCSRLVNNIDRGKYNSMNELLKEHLETKPVAPVIQNIDRFSCKIPAIADTLEIKYYNAMDSVFLKGLMVKPNTERKCDYVVSGISTGKKIIYGIVDLDGQWVVRPAEENDLPEEVAGIYFREYSNQYEPESSRLLRVNKKNKKLEITPYKVYKVYDNTFILIENEEGKWGILHRSGKTILPVHFESISYDTRTRYFVAKTGSNPAVYKLYNEKGKKALSQNYREIKIISGEINTTKFQNGQEIHEVFDRNLKKIR